MNLLFCIDNNYIDRFLETVMSIFRYENKNINIFILHNGISDENIKLIESFILKYESCKVIFYYVDTNNKVLPISISYISEVTYLRLFAPFVIKEQIDRLLYLDCDIICCETFEDMYNTNLDGKIIGAVKNIQLSSDSELYEFFNNNIGLPENNEYINAGVLLIDVNKYKEYISIDDIVNFIEQNKEILVMQDQDVINKLFYKKIKILDLKYNYQINSIDDGFETYDNVFVHYSKQEKPWFEEYDSIYKAIPYYYFLEAISEYEKLNNLKKIQLNNYEKKYNIQIDIIIPMYNSLKTIAFSLESIRNQKNLPFVNVYLIDDASSDIYIDIIKKYRKLLNLNYFKMEKNSGPGVARNKGLELSSSKYIVFLDSDDVFFDEYSLYKLYSNIVYNNADVVRSVVVGENDDKNIYYKNDNIGLHGKIYNRKFLNENFIKFNSMYSNEDTSFNAIIKMCGAFYFDIIDKTYIWRNNKKSLSKNEKYNPCLDLKNLIYNMYYSIESAILKNCSHENIIDYILECYLEIFYRRNNINNDNKNFVDDYLERIYNVYKKFTNISLIDLFEKKYDINFEEVEKKQFYDFLNKIVNNYCPIQSQTERMKKGYVYLPLDFEKGIDREKHLKLLQKYNQTLPFERTKEKELLLNEMLGSNGGCVIEPPFYATWGGKNIYVESGTYIDSNVTFVDDANIYIGHNVLIGPGTKIFTVNHCTNLYLRQNSYLYSRDILIGNNVFIGGGSIILPGVHIGDNSIVAAGSVVNCDVPENVVVAGNPSKIVKKIEEDDAVLFDKDKIVDWENILY